MKKITMYGAGVIGGGFAAYFALKGLDVTIFVREESSIERAKPKVNAAIDSYIKYGIASSAEEIWSRISFTLDPKVAFENTYFVQENGTESLEQKHEMIRIMEKYLPVNAIIASSSSGIPVTSLAQKAKHPERIIVAHPFNPAYLIPLVEICKGEKTEQKYVDIAVEFYKVYDKTPIVLQKEVPGFVANRLAHALWREEIALVCEGVCTLEEADNAVCYGPGLRWAAMGPGLNYELGAGELGLKGMIEKFSSTSDSIFKDLAAFSQTPNEFPDLAGEQMAALIDNLPEHVGHTREQIADYRDSLIIDMLKKHKKL